MSAIVAEFDLGIKVLCGDVQLGPMGVGFGDHPCVALGVKVKENKSFVIGKQCLCLFNGKRLRLRQRDIIRELLIEDVL